MKNLIHEDLLEAIELTIKARNKLSDLAEREGKDSELNSWTTEFEKHSETLYDIVDDLSEKIGYIIGDRVYARIADEEKEMKAKS